MVRELRFTDLDTSDPISFINDIWRAFADRPPTDEELEWGMHQLIAANGRYPEVMTAVAEREEFRRQDIRLVDLAAVRRRRSLQRLVGSILLPFRLLRQRRHITRANLQLRLFGWQIERLKQHPAQAEIVQLRNWSQQANHDRVEHLHSLEDQIRALAEQNCHLEEQLQELREALAARNGNPCDP